MSGAIRHTFASGQQDQFNLRLPDGMRDRIRAAADRNGRSMNAEIVATLEAAYPPIQLEVKSVDGVMHYIAGAPDAETQVARVKEVNERFAAMGSLLRIEVREDGAIAITSET